MGERQSALISDRLDNEDPREFVARLKEAKRLLLKLELDGEPSEIVEFDISGLEGQLKAGFEACFPEVAPAAAQGEEPKPFVGKPLPDLVVEALACGTAPSPGPILGLMQDIGMIDPAKNIGSDSLFCFEIKGGRDVEGLSFSHVCGFEEDDAKRAEYPDLFYRGPGTSPGQILSFETSAEEPVVRDWYERIIGGQKIDKAVSADFPSFATTEVKCTSCMH